MKKVSKNFLIVLLTLLLATSIIAIIKTFNEVEPIRTEFAEMISQTNTTAVFVTEDGHLFAAEVGELLELYTDYIIVFDTCGTADRTDDEILSVSKLIE